MYIKRSLIEDIDDGTVRNTKLGARVVRQSFFLDYCLNLFHDEGKHKARLFESALGITANDAEQVRNIILHIVKTHEAELGRRDEYGQRYTVVFMLE